MSAYPFLSARKGRRAGKECNFLLPPPLIPRHPSLPTLSPSSSSRPRPRATDCAKKCMQDKEKGSVEASEREYKGPKFGRSFKKSQVERRGKKVFSPSSTIVQGKANLAIGSKSLTLKFSAFEEMFFSSWSVSPDNFVFGPKFNLKGQRNK